MCKKSHRTRSLKSNLTIGILMIFLMGFFAETIFTIQDQANTELVDSSSDESDEEETENSKKEWDKDYIPSKFTFHAIFTNFNLTFKDLNYIKSNQFQSVNRPPPDLI
ncbi:MAG: hypothetical protein ACI9Z3_000576 [Roseivirga sp.]|jgi:hypothetical protein